MTPMKLVRLLSVLLLAFVALPVRAESVDLTPFIVENSVKEIAISPNGEYLAANVPIAGKGQTALVIFRREDMVVTGTLRFPKDTNIHRLWWVNPTRVLVELADTFGSRDYPSPTGELYGIDADGGRKELLVGWRVFQEQTGTRIRKGAQEERVFAFIVDTLPDENDYVLVKVQPFIKDPFNRVEKLNVYTGKRTLVSRAPVTFADFYSDNAGQVRFMEGVMSDNYNQLFYRASDADEWQLVNHERESGRTEIPLGFSADNRTAYLRVSTRPGPSIIVARDVATGKSTEVAKDALFDPQAIYRVGCGGCTVPVGAYFLTDKQKVVFFDETSEDARLHRSLEKAFPGNRVRITSSTDDGHYKVLEVESDINPGNVYLYDTKAKNASFILGRAQSIDPADMSPMRAISLKARDGLELHGYLTVPKSSSGKSLPMVVMPHGGPFGQFDDWTFNAETQMLAKAGYAVLQLNYRGSGNFGRAFREAGAREWGGKMQDDLTDATRWAIQQGIADAGRICLFGASYGAYASLMGVAKEPDLYRCAAGYVGVYDLPRMQSDTGRSSRSSRTWSREWVGDDDRALEAASPNRIASKIKVPVFLAAGGEDMIAPVRHTELMERALKDAGVPVESLYYREEGHGFYTEEHKREFYSRLLAFLSKHLGGATAK